MVRIYESGCYNSLTAFRRSMYVEVLFNALTGFLVQSFFAYRIWSCMLNPTIAPLN